ncbi:unnamed protein product, partial [marine sediment metagenome]
SRVTTSVCPTTIIKKRKRVEDISDFDLFINSGLYMAGAKK